MDAVPADGGPAGALWRMAGLTTPMAIRVLATLRVADLLAGGSRSAAELARAVSADPDALDRLLRHLAKRGVLRCEPSGRYALTPLAEPLRDDHPAGLRDWLDIEGPGRAELSLVELLYSVRTGEAAFPRQFGRPFWEDLAADPDRAASFHALLGADVRARVADITAGYDWSSLGHVVDVGGGDGSLLVALLTAHAGLRGTIVDLPGTAAVARKALAAAGLADRSEVVTGSFFDPLPAGAGGYLLSLVLHNWDDAAARSILGRCAQAGGAGSTVLVVERIDGTSAHTGMDLRMLAYGGGRERGVASLTGLAAEAGLAPVSVRPAGELTIVELVAG